MSTATPHAAPAAPAKLRVVDFLDGQLAFLQRRATPEERALIRWWRDRLPQLAKQEPKAEPIHPAAA